MKLKVGLVLKIPHNDVNHFIQILKIEQVGEALNIQILAGKTVNITRGASNIWEYERPEYGLTEELLEKIGAAIDKCLPG